MAINLLAQLLISVAISAIGYVLMPKPKVSKPEAAEDFLPTAEAGRPIVVVFGDMDVTETNWLWTGEKRIQEVEL